MTRKQLRQMIWKLLMAVPVYDFPYAWKEYERRYMRPQ